MKKLLNKPWVKDILSAIFISIFGFILIHVAFLFDFLYQTAIREVINLFIPFRPESGLNWFPQTLHFSYLIIVYVISYFIFKSKLKTIYKASFLTVPFSSTLVTLGMVLFNWQIINIISGAGVCIGVLCYLYYYQKSWMYVYTIVFWAITLVSFSLLGGEI